MQSIRSAGPVIAIFVAAFLGGLWLLRGAPLPSLLAIKQMPETMPTLFAAPKAALADAAR